MRQKILDLIQKSGFALTQRDKEKLILHDFGLRNFAEEGAGIIDLLYTERLRITLLILLPNQTVPQHQHPAYNDEKGKEESIRVLYGQTKIYVQGEKNTGIIRTPVGKENYYTMQHEICLEPGQQYTITPEIPHWFQAGSEGSVNIEFQNCVDEMRNIFFDPACILR